MLKRLHMTLDERQDREAGFTLIELLIVVIILGILAAIVVFSVGGVTNNAASSSCQTTVKTIDTAAEAYLAQNGSNAATIGDLVTAGFLHGDSNFSTSSGTSVGPIGTGTSAYTVKFTKGTGVNASSADSTTCPASS